MRISCAGLRVIFRQTYRYPDIKFSDIGRKCFAWALRQAWVEAREVARVVAMAPAAKAERTEMLYALIAHAGYIDSGPQWKTTISAHREEIRKLEAASNEAAAMHLAAGRTNTRTLARPSPPN